nr:alpha-mannosidase 2-like [Leptinotarsa decemlineata]
MPTMAYIEDEYSRLTVTTSTPLGCSSLAPGQLEIMLDRRLNQDDNRGLGQGVLDNHPTRHIFRIVLEKRVQNCRATAENHPAGFPTLSSHVVSQTLLNPIIRMLKVDDGEEFSNGAYTFVKQEIGVDISMPILKNNVFVKGTPHVGLVVHRQFLDICFSDQAFFQQFRLSEGVVNVSNLIPGDMNKKLYKTSLSFLTVGTQVDLNGNQEICPMKMQAFILGS